MNFVPFISLLLEKEKWYLFICLILFVIILFCFLQPADAAKYLSYESYPVLCRDAAATYLPPNEVELSKKYICKQTFDCCRKCNHMFYTCSGDKHDKQPFGACMRAAYKCMCYCIDEKSNEELPYKKEAE